MANNNRGCLLSLFDLLVFAKRPDVDLGTEPLNPYESRSSVMTATERAFFAVLFPITDGACHAFTKIRLADLISVHRETSDWKSHFERLSTRRVDFLLCKHETLAPLLVIELDDPDHLRLDQIRGDDFIDSALTAAGIPVIHVKVQEFYDPKEIKKLIKVAILGPR
jgi:hypothetical protein